jgi:glutamate 5-kinase
LVSSGAIGFGMGRLGLTERPSSLAETQAVAAVGQGGLMQVYENFFSTYNQPIAQILLTKDVMDHPIKSENARRTFETLLSMGAIPIVNENDTISTEEIQESRFGDNDTLSAIVASLLSADTLVILSDIAGLYDQDPRVCKDAKLIEEVTEITDAIKDIAGGPGSAKGTGGMATKVIAAQLAKDKGIDTIISSGENIDQLFEILDGESIGTWFHRGGKQ